MNELALFAGAGGGLLGGHLLGWRTVCAVEIEPYAAGVLLARQNDGLLPPFPVWDDVRTFDGRPWRGCVDVISGGFPCQDISVAGKGAGIDGERSGLWSEMCRVICEVRPRFVLVENSPMLASRGLGRVLGDLAALGFDAEWDVFGAHHVGAPHKRDRMWILAYADGAEGAQRWDGSEENDALQGVLAVQNAAARAHVADPNCQWEQQSSGALAKSGGWIGDGGQEDVPHADMPGRKEQRQRESAAAEHATAECLCEDVPDPHGDGWREVEQHDGGGTQGKGADGEALQCLVDPCGAHWWSSEPNVGRVADGVAARVDRLRALGNGQVPLVAATAFRELYRRAFGKEYQS